MAGGGAGMIRPATPRYAAYVAILFLLLGLVQLGGSLLFYQEIGRQTVREDHARRVAELLVVSDRMYALAPEQTARSMTTRHLSATVSPRPSVRRPASDAVLKRIARQIVTWEPSLAGRSLNLSLTDAGLGERDLVGSIALGDGQWLNFRSRDISTIWPVAWWAIGLTFIISALCLGFGLLALHLLGRPLRRVTEAAEAIGHGREVVIAETGPRDLRKLAQAMNTMQKRIFALIEDQAKAFEAISHDLRTPLSRQKAICALVDDAELAGILDGSVVEMDGLLNSLQDYLQAQHMTARPESLDLVALVRDLAAEYGDAVSLEAPPQVLVTIFREPVATATRALVENAVQYGERACVRIERCRAGWTIAIEDDGPGIPEEFLTRILEPFFRLDEARQRNTRGFGLGIPTAHRLMMRFGGKLTFGAGRAKGVSAVLEIPVAKE